MTKAPCAAGAAACTRVKSATGATSMLVALQGVITTVDALQFAANAPLLAPNASAASEAASATRTARVIGATLMMRLRRELADVRVLLVMWLM